MRFLNQTHMAVYLQGNCLGKKIYFFSKKKKKKDLRDSPDGPMVKILPWSGR